MTHPDRPNLGTAGPFTGVKGAPVRNLVTAGAWVITFRTQDLPREMDFEVWHAAVKGPGGYFVVYLDTKMFGVGENGLVNEYSPAIPMYVNAGQEISFHWSTPALPAPTAILYLRKPQIGLI